MTTFRRMTAYFLLAAGWFLFCSCSDPLAKDDTLRPTRLYPDNKGVDIAWRFKISERGFSYDNWRPLEMGSPAVTEERVLIGGSTGILYCLNRRDGKLVWKKDLVDEIFSQPVVKGDRVYIGTPSGVFYALRLFDGTEIWNYNLRTEILAPPTLADGRIFLVGMNDKIVALNEEDGAFLWEDREDFYGVMSIRGHSAVTVSGNRAVVGFTSGVLAAFDVETGKRLWKSYLGSSERFNDVDATPVIEDGVIYTASFDGAVYAVDLATGRSIWRTDRKNASPLTLLDGRLYLGASEHGLYCLSKESGVVLWHVDLYEQFWDQKEGVLGVPIPYQYRYLVFSASGSGLYFVDTQDQALVARFTPGTGIGSTPAVHGQMVYALANDGYLYALALARKGSPFTPYKAYPGQPKADVREKKTIGSGTSSDNWLSL